MMYPQGRDHCVGTLGNYIHLTGKFFIIVSS